MTTDTVGKWAQDLQLRFPDYEPRLEFRDDEFSLHFELKPGCIARPLPALFPTVPQWLPMELWKCRGGTWLEFLLEQYPDQQVLEEMGRVCFTCKVSGDMQSAVPELAPWVFPATKVLLGFSLMLGIGYVATSLPESAVELSGIEKIGLIGVLVLTKALGGFTFLLGGLRLVEVLGPLKFSRSFHRWTGQLVALWYKVVAAYYALAVLGWLLGADDARLRDFCISGMQLGGLFSIGIAQAILVLAIGLQKKGAHEK